MNKSAVMSHFSAILDNMLDNSLYFDVFFQQPVSANDISGSIDDIALPENLNIYFGATRGCIVDDNYDYVVKFDVDEDNDGGSCCARECKIYEKAKARNLDRYFVEAEYLGSYTKTIMFYDFNDITRYYDFDYYYCEEFDDDFVRYEDSFGTIHPVTISIPLYAYRKANYYHDEPGDMSNYVQMAKRITSPMRDKNLGVAVSFVRNYGEEAYEVLTDFMYEEGINDLHGGNIGKVDNRMVFIDFSGYHKGYDYCNSSEE